MTPYAVTLHNANRETSSLKDTRWDVVVIGAGPAGAFAAYKLASRGQSVLLVEKQMLPRYKVCGCCVSNASIQILGELGQELLSLTPQTTHAMRLFVDSKQIDLSIPHGISISRQLFDSFLAAKAIQAGASISMGSAASTDPRLYGDFRRVELARDAAVYARCVLAADGLNGMSLAALPQFNAVVDVNSKIGAGSVSMDSAAFENGIIYMACADEGYVGAVVIDDGYVDIAAAVDPRSTRRGASVAASIEGILRTTEMPVPADLAKLDWKGTVSLTRKRKTLAGQRIFVIGDSAAYVEPFTGEGILWALSTATAVADFAAETIHSWRPALAADWQAAHASSIQRRQRICKTVSSILRHPNLMHPCGTILSAAPYMVKPIIAAMNQPPVWEVAS